MSGPERRSMRMFVAVGVGFVLLVGSMAASFAAPGTPTDTRSERERVRREQAAAAAELDVLRATNAEVEAALDALKANVAGEEAALADAERAAAAAEAALADARARETVALSEIEQLERRLGELAVEAYTHAGSGADGPNVLASGDINDAVQRDALVNLRAGQYEDVLARLDTVAEDLAIAREDAESAAQAASARRAETETRLDAVRGARDQQAAVAAEVDRRIETALAESANLAALDADLSNRIAAEQATIAARNTGGGGGGGGGGSVGNVDVRTVRGITVAASIADQLEAMLAAAEGAGIVLGGGGYRSSESQMRLREQNCPDPYNSPPSACSPPTARPGQSMHERGLAIDFTYGGRVINSRSSPAFQWLDANAASYGFSNLPSEPWHWSTNGN